MNLNVRAALFCGRRPWPRHRIAAGIAGSIINMSLQIGHAGSAGHSLYCATKWAMRASVAAWPSKRSFCVSSVVFQGWRISWRRSSSW
ncbi:hypothetical protein PY650_09545 [Rhizobium calliandrae]|uniref:SDR family NAD(P)-dependent oxidoreductase n=1 Tax=Rhizobium calliandrae TaxID=1312182 RepID=A0ABT7KFG8_9HYPH|nr:hypothetical protein [Rhizobium calliandrae]MDL2405904.1 hypothetical protein [Rhizobium calliandrae]